MNKVLAELPGVRVAIIEGANADGKPLVRLPDASTISVPARVVWMAKEPDWRECAGLRVVVGFEGADLESPIVLGFLDPPEIIDAGHDAAVDSSKPEPLRIENDREIVLECGKAKISLRADGRIVILGGYVLSRSRGVHKIKGGSVQVN